MISSRYGSPSSGISALDPRVAETDQYIRQKNIPPDQVEDFLLSMGADPRLASLVFKYRNIKDAAAKQGQPPAPSTTVADDINNQYTQMNQRGLASMPAPAMANAAMQGGITGEPEQRMAGGGVVALAGGGFFNSVINAGMKAASALRRNKGKALVGAGGAATLLAGGDDEDENSGVTVEEEKPAEMTEEDYSNLSSIGIGATKPGTQTAPPAAATPATPTRRGIASTLPITMPTKPTYKDPDLSPWEKSIEAAKKDAPESREAAYEKARAREEKLGQNKIIEERLAGIETEEKEAKMNPRQMFWMAVSKAGFAASAKGARNLAETLAYGGQEGINAFASMKDKQNETLAKLRDKKLELKNMQIAIQRGIMDKADQEYKDGVNTVRDLQLQLAAQHVVINQAANTRSGQEYLALVREAGDTARTNAQIRSNEQLQADRLASAKEIQERQIALTKEKNRLDEEISRRAIQMNSPGLTPAQRASLKKYFDALKKARMDIEGTESSVQSTRARIEAQNAQINDGFGDVSEG